MGDRCDTEGQEGLKARREALLQFFLGWRGDVLGEEILPLPDNPV